MPRSRKPLISTASIGEAVPLDIGNAAPILDVAAPALGPALTVEPIPGLPPELQPLPGDILLSKAFWPWEDLGARGIPESWLYMSRHVQGTIAMLAVQTSAGPKLVNANPDGTIVSAQAPNPSTSIYLPGAVNDPNTYTLRQTFPFVALSAQALAAASTTDLMAVLVGNNILLKKILVSVTGASLTTITLLDDVTSFLSVILPVNPQPFEYEWPGHGYLLASRFLRLNTSAAITCSVTLDNTNRVLF